MTPTIEIVDVTLRFRIYTNRSPGLKESLMQLATRKKDLPSVIKFNALENLNLRIEAPERLGIVGLNGAGKSTLLKMIAGIYSPHNGHVEIRGEVTPLIELGTGFDEALSGRENIYLNGTMLRRSFRQMQALEDEIIAFAELEEFIDSSGMRGRLAFAIATAVPTDILLIDEIFSIGDERFVAKASEKMGEIVNNAQIVILVTHDMYKIAETTTRSIVIDKGKVAFDGKSMDAIEYYLKNIVNDEAKAETFKADFKQRQAFKKHCEKLKQARERGENLVTSAAATGAKILG